MREAVYLLCIGILVVGFIRPPTFSFLDRPWAPVAIRASCGLMVVLVLFIAMQDKASGLQR
jgi:hypothetical protein